MLEGEGRREERRVPDDRVYARRWTRPDPGFRGGVN